jgi:hypothetical protein
VTDVGPGCRIATVLGFKHRTVPVQKDCAHPHAIPRWDRVEDEGKLDRVARWYCPACDRFVPAPRDT